MAVIEFGRPVPEDACNRIQKGACEGCPVWSEALKIREISQPDERTRLLWDAQKRCPRWDLMDKIPNMPTRKTSVELINKVA